MYSHSDDIEIKRRRKSSGFSGYNDPMSPPVSRGSALSCVPSTSTSIPKFTNDRFNLPIYSPGTPSSPEVYPWVNSSKRYYDESEAETFSDAEDLDYEASSLNFNVGAVEVCTQLSEPTTIKASDLQTLHPEDSSVTSQLPAWWICSKHRTESTDTAAFHNVLQHQITTPQIPGNSNITYVRLYESCECLYPVDLSNIPDVFNTSEAHEASDFNSITGLSYFDHLDVPIPISSHVYSNNIDSELELIDEVISPYLLEGKMKLHGDFIIHINKWNDACAKTSMVKAAQILFEELFSEEEIQRCTMKGKKGTKKLDPIKKLSILRAVSWLVVYWKQESNDQPSNYNCDLDLVRPLDIEEKKVVQEKIFTNFRNQKNQRKRKINDDGAINTTVYLGPVVDKSYPPVVIGEFSIPRSTWAEAFYDHDYIHTAGFLFEAIFTPEEIMSCTLNGKKKTSILCSNKREEVLRITGWMKDKRRNPYNLDDLILNRFECLSTMERKAVTKSVFTQKRNQLCIKLKQQMEMESRMSLD